MKTPCLGCLQPVFETAPACPSCGTRVYVEHPANIVGVKHRSLSYPRPGILSKAVSFLSTVTLVR